MYIIILYIATSITNLIFFITFLYLITLLITKYKNIYYKKETIEIFLRSPENFLQYLDKFYVRNIVYSWCALLVYFFSTIFFFVYIRVKYLGTINDFQPSNIFYNDYSFIGITKTLIFISLLILSFILLKTLLDILFFDEILKLHIYYYKNKFYSKIIKVSLMSLRNILGNLYLFFDCVSRLMLVPNEDAVNHISVEVHVNYAMLFENSTISKLCLYCVTLSKKFKIIHGFFIVIAKICKVFYCHLRYDGVIKYLPYICLLFTFIYEFINNKFMYIYYVLFICLILNIIFQFVGFLSLKKSLVDLYLYNYFYKNELDYKKQRLLFKNKTLDYVSVILKAEQAYLLFNRFSYEDTVRYIRNDLINSFLQREPHVARKAFIMCIFNLLF